MAAIHINEQQLQELIDSKKDFLVDFWAPWCGDCRRIEKPYDEIADAYAGVLTVVKINVDDFDGIRQRWDIRRIPTIRLFQQGEPQGQIVEPPAKADIEAFLVGILPKQQKQQDETVHDMVIIGGGPGGYTAALYAARAGMNPLVLERLSAGGQMALTHQIDNYPGFVEGIDGFTLADNMLRQAERFGARTEYAQVNSLELAADPKAIHTSEGTFYARTVVISTGAGPRELGLAEEKSLVGRGVAYCAACDGMFYRGKTVVVVGGGNTAAADALLLSRVAKKVIVVHRRDTLRATKIYHKPLLEAENVEFYWNSAVKEIRHGQKVSGVVLENLLTGEKTELDCDGVFISVGRKPATELVAGQLALDAGGYIEAGESTQTSLPGVYAVGDVRTKALRQVVTAVADGAMAVHMAEEFLADQ